MTCEERRAFLSDWFAGGSRKRGWEGDSVTLPGAMSTGDMSLNRSPSSPDPPQAIGEAYVSNDWWPVDCMYGCMAALVVVVGVGVGACIHEAFMRHSV